MSYPRKHRGYQYEGEPRLIMTPDGVTIEFKGGQPVMDTGLENAALISLFTDKGWWGNAVLSPEEQIGKSDFEKVASGTISISMLTRTANEAKLALKWMVSLKIVQAVDAIAWNRDGLGIDVVIVITGLDGSKDALKVSKYGANWLSQVIDPAQARLTP